MDIELLRTFITVTRVRHFGKAAEQLCITPAAVSARIRQLEQMLGVSLLERARGNIHMTAAGERLLPHARRLLDAWTLAQADLSLPQSQSHPIRLGHSPCLNLLLGDWLVDHNRNPVLLPATLISDTHAKLQLAVEQGRLDAALLTTPLPDSELSLLPLGNLKLVFALAGATQSVDRWVHLDWGFPTPPPEGWVNGQTLACQDGLLAQQIWRKLGGGIWLPEALASLTLADQTASRLIDPEAYGAGLESRIYLAYRTEKEAALQPLIELIGKKLADES